MILDGNSSWDPTVALTHHQPAQVAHVARTMFLAIAEEWELSPPEQARLLGFGDMPSFESDFLDQQGAISEAQLIRISHLTNIHRAIATLIPLSSHGTWLRYPSKILKGESPLTIMLRDGDAGLAAIHHYLDAQIHG